MDPADRTNGRLAGAPRPVSKADKNRGIHDPTHGNIVDGDILDEAPIHAFDGEPATVVEDAIGDGDVLETAVGFGAEFDAAVAAGITRGPPFEGAIYE